MGPIDYSSAYKPADTSGLASAAQSWAQRKMLNDYRGAELKRQYAQIQAQKDNHAMQVMSKFLTGYEAVVAAPKAAQPGVFKIWAAQAKTLFPQMDTDGFKNLLKDPDVMSLDSVEALKNTLQGMGAAPDKSQKLAQALGELKASTSDPLLFRQLVGSVTKQYEGQQRDANKAGIDVNKAKQLAPVKVQTATDIAQAKHDMGPTAAQSAQNDAKDVTTYQKMLDTTDYRKASGVLNDIDITRSLIESAHDGNGVSLNMLPVGVAKLFVAGAGRLNQAEIKAAGGSKAITSRIAQAFDEMTQGKLSDQNAKLMNQLADVMEQGAVQKKFDIENGVAKQYAQKSGMPVEDAYEKLTGSKYPGSEDSEDDSKSALDSLDADKKAKLQSWIQAHKAAGTSDEDIKSQIKGSKLGLDLSDEDYNSLAPQATPTPPAAPASPANPGAAPAAPSDVPAPQPDDQGNQ